MGKTFRANKPRALIRQRVKPEGDAEYCDDIVVPTTHIVCDATASTMCVRVTEFRRNIRSLPTIPCAIYEPFILDLIGFLKSSCKDHFGRAMISPDELQVMFCKRIGNDTMASADPYTGIMEFSNRELDRLDDTWRSHYLDEKPVAARFVKDKVDALIWIVLHELNHLFDERDAHDVHFFAEVESLAQEFHFLFKR
eukprot:TRINITY_DN11628_c0_g1_i1.p1 TRINITY_DN11628_c0_g1~~TRINITY_DN11628_c0_g1_i1.p1  ORF type:complete len:205 (-),score=22.94 TRINITY_DN11628_c0_g1_i1:758-1345(-)